VVPPSGKNLKYQPNGGKKHGATSAHTIDKMWQKLAKIGKN
jgi:hypothetical protein